MFLVASGVAIIAFLLSWLIEEQPLRDSVTASTGIGESFAVPKPDDSLAELSRALNVLIGQVGRRRLIEQLVARAGVDLSAAGGWLVGRIEAEPATPLADMCSEYAIPVERGEQALTELFDKGMIREVATPRDGDVASENSHAAAVAPYELTDAGREAAEKLTAARRESLAQLVSDWDPELHEDLGELLTKMAKEYAPRGAEVAAQPAIS